MAIRKKVPVRRHGAAAGATADITLPAFSYQNDKLADLIVAIWGNGPFNSGGVNVQKLGDAICFGPQARDNNTGLPTASARAAAKAAVNFFAGMDLDKVVIITEDEHDDDYTMQDPDEVVFVLPRESRVIPTTVIPNAAIPPRPTYSSDLLETAKVLMACTPNGI
jgi:hypothetical protein